MRNGIVAVAMAGLLFAAPAAAQNTFGIGAFAGVSLPMGGYSDDVAAGPAAEMGFTGGVELFYPLAMMGNLSWLTSVSATAHSADEDWTGGTTSGGYFYVPLMTGLRFDVPAGPLGLFATGQLGLVLNWGPDRNNDSASMGSHFGFALGGGVQATRNFYVGAKYFPLGDVGFEYDDVERDRSVSFLDIYLGFGVR